jgi:adenosylmethionine-8-amino-7-oxononanoate aminotransferase
MVCLAKAIGGGVPCGAIGGTEEVMGRIADGTYEQVGTFNGNPLTMAAARATLTEILTPGKQVAREDRTRRLCGPHLPIPCEALRVLGTAATDEKNEPVATPARAAAD